VFEQFVENWSELGTAEKEEKCNHFYIGVPKKKTSP
jgi:hypothetical protein